MIILYRVFLYLFLPVVLIRLLLRASRNRQYFNRIPQRFGWKLGIDKVKGGIWIHAVSVGEANAAVPLVKYLKSAYPDKPLLITTMTPTGADRIVKTFGDSVTHCYLPYDYPGAVKRFLAAAQPELAMIMETEIWPNYIEGCNSAEIPMIYTNVRLSARSYNGYKRFLGLFSRVLGKVDQFAVQSAADAERLVLLGARSDRVHTTGSIKFDIELPASTIEASQSVRRSLGWDRPVWVAGSTHEGEESQILDAFLLAKKKCPDLLLVLVPRHPERFNTVSRLCTRFGCNTVQRTQSQAEILADVDVYLVDTMGELALFIAASDFTFIGGSLVPTGGHNVLEACAAGVAVIFGPYMFNFQEISDQVLSRGAGVQIMTDEELADVVVKLVQDPVLRDQYGVQGKQFVEENRGALEKIQQLVEGCLDSE
jgi:3-deoxy-D-manno-octulosonic-acid transferase